MKIYTQDNMLYAEKKGMTQLLAWHTPEGDKCYSVDSAIASFARFNGTTLTKREEQKIRDAVKDF